MKTVFITSFLKNSISTALKQKDVLIDKITAIKFQRVLTAKLQAIWHLVNAQFSELVDKFVWIAGK